MEIQGEMIGFRVEHVSEIQRHDGDALRIGVRKTHDLACCDNRLDLPRIGHLTVGTPHHAMPSRNRLLIIAPRHFNRLQLQTFTLLSQRIANTIKQTAHASRGLTCRKTMIYCWKSESHRASPLLLRGRAPRRYETFERLVEETIFEDIGTLHDRYQEFGIYPLLTLLMSFA